MPNHSELKLLNVEDSSGLKPCRACEAIVPDRRRLDDIGNIPTTYERIDIYPEFPGLLSSADQGCRLCCFLQEEFSSRAFLDIEFGRVPASWASQDSSWDRRVKISVSFSFLPFIPVSPANNFAYRLDGFPPQYNGVVNSMLADYKPVIGPLRGKDDVPWNGAVVEYSVFDSPGMSIAQVRDTSNQPHPYSNINKTF
ncbi:hypothetical protein M426DRAFT_12308 [Hypoxylon sp. CI-4A]|nr:hypothetical protein M426DRAFT_12308 [Hypoxylon sp. CI-4A]